MTQYKLEFIPMEEDLLSLEMDDVARDIHLVSLQAPQYAMTRS